jgi:sarcosine oxidase, subunit beta
MRAVRAEIAIVGGGVIGLACAASLVRAGVQDVVVLEAEPAPGQGASSRANGGVRAQFTTVPNIAFSRYSIEAFERMQEETDLVAFHQTGYLLITATEAGERSLRAAMDLQRAHGVDTRWLEPGQVIAAAPFVRPDGIRGATFHARDGFLDPAGVVAALEREVRAAATLRTGVRVRGATRVGEGWALRIDGEDVIAGRVVNAAGANAREVAALFGAHVPVEPVRRNLALFLDEPGPLTPMCVDLDTGVLARREPGGAWVVAYSNPHDPPGRATGVDPAFFGDLAERLPRRFPFLAELPLDPGRCWAGLYPETPDHHAIVGEDPDAPGLLQCVGFGGHGVMHAPAAGRAIAELIVDGVCTSFDLAPLRPSRFREGDLVDEAAVF